MKDWTKVCYVVGPQYARGLLADMRRAVNLAGYEFVITRAGPDRQAIYATHPVRNPITWVDRMFITNWLRAYVGLPSVAAAEIEDAADGADDWKAAGE